MKKIIAVIVFIIIIILIILGIRSCEPRVKPGAGDPYFDPFVRASVEYVCIIAKEFSFNDESEEAKAVLNEIYEKHGLPVDDNELMIEIYQKYENNAEIINAINENINDININDCSDFN
jgi:hypothetical protein